MNSPVPPPVSPEIMAALDAVTLEDKYTLDKGRVYISGTQALVRLPMLQKARDRAAGLNTAGYISGYRGSPLGALDLSLWKAKSHLAEHDIVFQPGVNEELAATAVWGSQQVNLWPGGTREGVFGMWYGKGPGVDRTGDVFKHANSAGSAPHGGVLVLAGDDHAAKSSSVAHQSEHALIAAGIPVLYPASVQEYIDYGLHGWAMSRYSGLWVAMKCVTDVIESTASIDIDTDRIEIVIPQDFKLPADGVGIRWPDPPLAQEARLYDTKWYAALAYVRANRLNRVVIDSPAARFGIMSAGKAYLDTRQALLDLGLNDQVCAEVGIRLFKVGCIWPLDAQDARAFATGLEEILVVEEKRQILEYALKEELYNWRDDVRPRVYGKFDERDNEGGEWSVPRGDWLLPAPCELSPALIARAIAKRLARAALPAAVRQRIDERLAVLDAKERDAALAVKGAERPPWFCSGCPHNTSTRVPEGSRAMAGIGCHYMAMWMDRSTETFSQMGGEGVAWLGQMAFTDEKHVFVNLGDGTYFHSGILAVRAAVAANASITYKLLFNDAVAMTGGQPVDGVLTVPQIASQLVAEGVRRLLIVSDEPEKYASRAGLPASVTVHHRDALDDLQRELREVPGTSVLIYDQTCATEKRRRRKRGTYPDPAKRVFINDAVCEGCGDCSVQSNCLSVEPLQTPLGTKRKINQSSCNKDFSCVKGFCPSFVTAEGAQVRKPRAVSGSASSASPVPASAGAPAAQAVSSTSSAPSPANAASTATAAVPAGADGPPDFDALPQPALPPLEGSYGILVAGVGGTGVVTIGGLLGMAAHLEHKGVTVLDMAGLAQKGGAVISHIQVAPTPGHIHATRVAMGEARLVIGCDAIVAAQPDVLSKTLRDVTRVVINSGETPTAAFLHDPDWTFPAGQAAEALRRSVGEHCSFVDANQAALSLLGDAIYANPLVLGYAWQTGAIPLALASLMRAIELNGVSVDKNRLAFQWGRQLAAVAHLGVDGLPAALANKIRAAAANRQDGEQGARQSAVVMRLPQSLDKLAAERAAFLAAYQNEAWAGRYLAALARLREKETAVGRGHVLGTAVARNLAKLMSYKDEYEVARLHADPVFLDKMREQFEGEPGRDYRLVFHLAPPLLSRRDAQGHLVKRRFGGWMLHAFRVLARLKPLRGHWLDPFGHSAERRAERALIDDYFSLLDEFATSLDGDNYALAVALANLPESIRGYGHVKERNMAQAAQARHRLLADYRAAGAGRMVA